nr:hypothetical protein [uncultured Flavobacterium sp.]
MKTNTLALMETASFCAGVRHKRYSGQQEAALKNNDFCSYTIQSPLFRYIYTTNLLL